MEDCFHLSPQELGLFHIFLGDGAVFQLTTTSYEASNFPYVRVTSVLEILKICVLLVGLFRISAWGLLWKVLFNLFLKVKRF